MRRRAEEMYILMSQFRGGTADFRPLVSLRPKTDKRAFLRSQPWLIADRHQRKLEKECFEAKRRQQDEKRRVS